MRRKKFIKKSIAIILLMSWMAVTFILFMKLDIFTGKRKKETANDRRHFLSFCDRNKPDWLTMISRSLKTLEYFENHLNEMVTDVAVGTRIMEAQINVLLKTRLNLSAKILQDLEDLQRKSKLVGDTIVQRHSELFRNPEANVTQIERNLHWIQSASTWATPDVKQWRTLMQNSSLIIEPAHTLDMNTDFGPWSDGCIFATFENCAIPDYCIDFLWKEPHSGYLLTHQILFHYMIVQNNCFSGENRIFYESQNLVEPKKFLETMCRRVLPESKRIEQFNYLNLHRDLFVEQILVCSLAGFNDFLTRHWTNVILDWAGSNGVLGCYTVKPMWNSRPRRVKRWDNFFYVENVRCSVHMGALILGVIGQQLRYFLEMCYEKDALSELN